MSVIGGPNNPISNGLVYALDFKNNRCYVSGSKTIKSLYYDPATTIVTGSFTASLNNVNLNIPSPTSRISITSENDFYIQRTGSTFAFDQNSAFTIAVVLNTQIPGAFLFQNTSNSKFAANISTSSLDIGFYNPTTENYYTRRFLSNQQTGSVDLVYRYDNGTADVFLNGLPVTSSQTNVVPTALFTTSYKSGIKLDPISGSLFIGANSIRGTAPYEPNSIVTSYSGSISNVLIYNRALSSTEIYTLYAQANPTTFPGAYTKPYTLDENTLLFVSASGITSSAYVTAINDFITGLKSASLWTKLSAIYPVIGSTTSSQAINLKEPGVNRLVYSGSWLATTSGSFPSSSVSYLQLPGFDYPAIATSSAHITYLSYDLPQATSSLVAVDKPLAAIGGEIFYSGSRVYHVFKPTGTGSFTVFNPSLTSVELLAVGGGGGGGLGGYSAGGGGAGGLVYSASFTVTTQSYNVVVGEGGYPGLNGLNSTFSTITAYGGGAGNSGNGGSGGGAGSTFNTTGSGGTASYAGQGNNGGDSLAIYVHGAGGGGGAGTPGQIAGIVPSRAGAGGSGSYFGQYAGIGLGSPAGWFAGGGGGSNNFANDSVNGQGPGGIGGGARGVFSNDYNYGNTSGTGVISASKNTGGGGGGGAYICGANGAGAGGSGIVVISYNTSSISFTSSFGLSISGSNIVGNLHSTTNSGISFDASSSIGLITVTRTGSTSLSIHRDITSSIITSPVSASIIGSVYGNASNFAGTLSRVSPYTLSYLSYGAGLTPSEVTTYHSLASKLQYDLGRAKTVQIQSNTSFAYSLRQISKNYPYAINVRRSSDDLQQDIGFTANGDLNTGSLLTFLTASITTPLPGDISTPAAAYSVRKVRTAYTGSAMTVRRDFDDVTFDVGFDGSGNLNTGSLLTNMTASGLTTTLPGDYSGLAAAYSLRRVSSSYSGYVVEVRRATDNYSASIGFDGSGNLNTASLASFIRTGSETPISAYSGLAAAYSLRKVVPGYAGAAIEIQSGSVSQSIGFNSFGDLDVTAIRTFAGSGDAFVKTWFDQSGNGYHATQSVIANQPQIYSGASGSVITDNGKPAVYFSSKRLTSPYIATPPFSVFHTFSSRTGEASSRIYVGGNSFGWYITSTNTGGEISYGTGGNVSGITQILNQQLTHFTLFSGSISGVGRNDGSFNIRSTGTTPQNVITIIGAAEAGGSNALTNSYISEILLYNADQTANRTYIQNNINSYYGIYTPSSVSTENAFVKTWYDQSGNNRHATQSVDASQPQIVSSGLILTSSLGKPSVKFDGVDDYLDTATITVTSQSIFSVQQNVGSKGVDVIFGADGNSNYTNNIGGNAQVSAIAGTYDAFTGGYSTTSSITSYHRDGIGTVSGSFYLNGSRLIQTISGSTTQSANYSDLGGFSPYTFQGFISEFVLYNNSKLSSRGRIEDNINGYYNIFTQSLASGSGYVTRWYDQSGNNKHATQASIASQPLIVSSGSIQTLSGSIGLNFYIAGNPMCYLEFSGLSGVNSPEAFFVGSRLFNFNGTLGQEVEVFSFNSRTRRFRLSPTRVLEVNSNTSSSVSDWTGNAGKHLVNVNISGSGSFLNYNLNSGTTVNIPTMSVTDGYLSDNFYGSAAGGYYHEFILYPTSQVLNRPIIKNNINNYFNIYTPNTVSSSLHITQWYDQSGNGRHATQSYSFAQPTVVSSGSLNTLFGKPTVRFSTNGLDIINPNYGLGGNNTIFFVHQAVNGAVFGSFYRYWNFQSSTSVQMGSGGTNLVSSESIITGSLITSIQDSGVITGFKNGRNVTTTQGVRNPLGGLIENIGYSRASAGVGGDNYNGTISEVILIPNQVLPITTRQVYESDINSYYRIY